MRAVMLQHSAYSYAAVEAALSESNTMAVLSVCLLLVVMLGLELRALCALDKNSPLDSPPELTPSLPTPPSQLFFFYFSFAMLVPEPRHSAKSPRALR